MKAILSMCLVMISFGWSAAQETPRGEPASAVAVEGRNDTTRVHSDEDLKKAMATVGLNELPAGREWERQKSAKVAVMSSMLMPGLGQAYNGRKLKAGVFMGLFTFFASSSYVERKTSQEFLSARDSYPTGSQEWHDNDLYYEFHRTNAGDFLWWAGAVWFIGLLDAFVDAHLYDVRAVDPTIFKGSGGQKYVGLSYDL